MNGFFLTLRRWLPLFGLTVATFVFNTTEFIPIGLLSDIGRSFGIGEAQTGLLISVYAWMVALLSLPLMMLAARVPYRRLLLGTVAFFVLCHVASGFASSFGMLMASRIGVACTHAIFWSIVSPIAVRIAPRGKDAVALGMILGGSSIAMIVGLPLGRAIGLHLGWRASFFGIAGCAAALFLLLLCCFPNVAPQKQQSFRFGELLRRKSLMVLNIFTLLLVTAHYTAYSYIEPFLAQAAHISDHAITVSLMVFGLAGIISSVLFSLAFRRYAGLFALLPGAGITCLLLGLPLFAASFLSIALLCVLWGMCITTFNLVAQTTVLHYAPKDTTLAMAMYSGIYNVGIGLGSVIGGRVESQMSVGCIGYVGGGIALLALAFYALSLRPYTRELCARRS